MKSAAKKAYWILMGFLPDSWAVKLFFKRYLKKWPNLQNPQSLSEKINWRKLHQHNPLFSVYADKIVVKSEIEKLLGREFVIETLWTGTDPEKIPFDRLEPPYVVKVNSGSGSNMFVRSKAPINQHEIVETMKGQLAISYGRRFREWGYLGIKPSVLVERMLEMPGGDVPEDYKFFVYHGKVHFIQVDYSRFKGHRRNVYDRNFRFLDVEYEYPNMAKAGPLPENLEEMIAAAEKIGAAFDFCRVDLYSTPKGIKFGEVTFYPAAGYGPFHPQEWDYKFGEPWKIPQHIQDMQRDG